MTAPGGDRPPETGSSSFPGSAIFRAISRARGLPGLTCPRPSALVRAQPIRWRQCHGGERPVLASLMGRAWPLWAQCGMASTGRKQSSLLVAAPAVGDCTSDITATAMGGGLLSTLSLMQTSLRRPAISKAAILLSANIRHSALRPCRSVASTAHSPEADMSVARNRWWQAHAKIIFLNDIARGMRPIDGKVIGQVKVCAQAARNRL